ncbi:MAG TPA: polyhydroxyalkanoate synthesis repressor PhaR [Gammaproteobacteria bacterium]
MRTLKKYPNRRIYDTEESRFVTLSDVREMVLRHETFQVVDSKSGEDLTRNTLLQIIADLETEGHASVLTNKVLEDLIRFYGDAMGGVLGSFIEQSIAAFVEQEKTVRAQLRVAMENTPDRLLADMTRQYAEFWKQLGGIKPGRD